MSSIKTDKSLKDKFYTLAHISWKPPMDMFYRALQDDLYDKIGDNLTMKILFEATFFYD